jgi:hypothetical protein
MTRVGDTEACLCNDLQGHWLHMHEGHLALAFPRRRVSTGHAIHVRQAREELGSRVSHISLLSHMSCIHTSLLGV